MGIKVRSLCKYLNSVKFQEEFEVNLHFLVGAQIYIMDYETMFIPRISY